MNDRPQQMGGFTLIEVVIAFAILGVSLAVLYGAFENALARTRSDAHFSEGTMLAQSLLSRAGSEFSESQGSYLGEWNGYQYRLIQERSRVPLGQPPFTLPTLRVTAEVWWAGNAGTRNIEISTLRLAPRPKK